MKIESQEISLPILKEKDIRLFVKRLDKIHPFISGNKWFKLKYNLMEAKRLGYNSLLTFGGSYSNHIFASAFAAKEKGFRSVGVIRGEEKLPLNPTLAFASRHNMQFYYVSRENYRLKTNSGFLDNLKKQFGDFYLIPEGGTNLLAIKGTAEILNKADTQDYICCSVGTGGTIAGIVNASVKTQDIIGFPAIKGFDVLEKEIRSWTNKQNYKFIHNYTCNGYARVSEALVDFINEFYLKHNIPFDAIYTGKMMLGVMDLVSKNYFPKGSSVLVIHTGGLQANNGMNQRLGLNLPSINH